MLFGHPQVPTLERRTLRYPRTVCTSLSCHEVHEMQDGQNFKKFTLHCHAKCYLQGVQADSINNPGNLITSFVPEFLCTQHDRSKCPYFQT